MPARIYSDRCTLIQDSGVRQTMKTSLKRDVVIAGAARTPVGKFGGGLSSTPATQLGATALTGAIECSGIDPGEIDYVVMGNMLSAGLGQTPARQAAISAGIPETTSAITFNKACASGMAAVIAGSQMIQLGEAETVAAGGMENMSAAPHLLVNSRTGQRLGDAKLTDSMVHDGLWCPFENRHMAGSAEVIAAEYDVSRREQDEFAARSHQLAAVASGEGWFDLEIVPVLTKGRKGKTNIISVDEGPRPESTPESLGKLRPAFPPGESVTAGNASQISDGAAAFIIMSADRATDLGADPYARITGYAHSANNPGMLFDAPRTAVGKLLERTGMELGDFDLIEVNEAFAAQVLANGKALDWDWSKREYQGRGHCPGSSAWSEWGADPGFSNPQSPAIEPRDRPCSDMPRRGWGSGDKRGGSLAGQRDLPCRRWRKICHPPPARTVVDKCTKPEIGIGDTWINPSRIKM